MQKQKNNWWWLLGFILCISCTSGNVMVSNPSPMLNYIDNPSAETLKILSKQYRDVAKGYKKETPPPGFCADYALILFKNGKKKEAEAQLDLEKEHYPESELYVESLKQQLFENDEKK